MKAARGVGNGGLFLRQHFEEIISIVEPLVKDLYRGYESARVRQELGLLLLAAIQSREENDPQVLLATLREAFMNWIARGVYLDELERVGGRVVRGLEARFGGASVLAAGEDRELFYRIVRAYTRTFREFSERQLKQLEILNLLGDFTREDLRKLFAKVFRKTMSALGAQYGVLYYNDPKLQIYHQRLKGAGPPVTRVQLRHFMEDKSFDPIIVNIFSRLLQSGQFKEYFASSSRPGHPLADPCPVCRHAPTLATKFTAGVECSLAEGQKVSSLICVPFTRANEEKGKFLLARSGPPAFSRFDLEFLRALSADISRGVENYFLYNELREMATVDALTGVFNRRYLMDSIRKEHERAKRYGKQYSLIMADLDHFKQINDQHGHAAGDQVLRTFGRLLRENSRLTDILGRYGGEEFLIVIPESPVSSAAQYAERLKHMLNREKIPISGGQTIQLTASFGVCGYPRHGRTVEGLLRKVDDFLYRAKEKGRNRVEVAP